jgi:DNA-binding PucR family transcriptional regulator
LSSAIKYSNDRIEPPHELRAALLPVVPTIVDAALAAIRDEGHASGAESALERNLRLGLTDAVDRWFEAGAAPVDGDLHFALGRAQARAGRSLDELMGFYRTAAQTMWRRLTEVGSARGLPPSELYRLADTGFGCVEQISTQAAAGFAEEQSHRFDASRSRRSELVRLLLKEPQPPAESLEAAAHAIGIELSPTLAVFAGDSHDYEAFTRAGAEQILHGPRDGEFIGVLLDPDGPARRRRLASIAESAGVQLALGPAVAIAGARLSLRRARALLALSRAELLDGGALLRCDDHNVELLLSADPILGDQLAQRALAPLASVRGESTRANLTATLRAWLRAPGQRKTIAHELGVHPQTVRYRMARLRELFGTALDDPDARFELELALRAGRYAALTTAPRVSGG